jgi:hypothetical protein
MGEVLRAKSQESPQLVIHWLQRELVREIKIFVSQSRKIPIVQGVFLISFGNGVQLQQSRLPHEDSLYLEEVISVMIHRPQRQFQRPLFKSISIDSEAIVSGQGYEIGILPVAVAAAHALLYRLRLLRKALGLQGAHPRVDSELSERWNYLIARRILVDGEQLLIVLEDILGDVELHLRQRGTLGVSGFCIYVAADVQNHVVVSFVLVVGVKKPVARLVVNLHVAHPKGSGNLDFGVEEIGPCIAVVQSGVDDFHLPVVGGGKRGEWEEFVLPHVVK